jgi:hypothetical protein
MSMTSQSLYSSLEQFKEGPPHEYEEAIQKLEGDVRMHIRVEQQMRLHIENKELKTEKKKLSELLNLKEEQIVHTK